MSQKCCAESRLELRRLSLVLSPCRHTVWPRERAHSLHLQRSWDAPDWQDPHQWRKLATHSAKAPLLGRSRQPAVA